MLSSVGEDKKRLQNRTQLLHDTLSRKVYPWVANEYTETDWDELLHSFSLASKQLDDLSGDLKAVYSMQVPAPKKPFPPGQHPIPQILSTMMDKEDSGKILVCPPRNELLENQEEDRRRAAQHNSSLDRVLSRFNETASS